jgi:Ca-activated chloride channel family protein
MRGARMQNVQTAAMDMVEALNPEDRLAIVTFSDRAAVVVPSELGDQKRVFRSSIASIAVGGGTEIYQGLATGIQQVQKNIGRNTINHVILLTDGRTYDDESLSLAVAREAEATGITISAFGIGEDWNDVFLDKLAQAGGGTSHYIDAPSKIRKILKSRFEDLTDLALRKVRLRVKAAPYVRLVGAYRAAPHMEILFPDQQSSVAVGSISVGEPSTLLFEFSVHQDAPGKHRLVRLELEGEVVDTSEWLRVSQNVVVTFTQTPATDSVPPRLLNLLSRLSIFRLQERAWRALDDGNTKRATQYLESAATHLFDLGYRELGHAAMLEVGRLSQGSDATTKGRKKLRYGTRALSITSS